MTLAKLDSSTSAEVLPSHTFFKRELGPNIILMLGAGASTPLLTGEDSHDWEQDILVQLGVVGAMEGDDARPSPHTRFSHSQGTWAVIASLLHDIAHLTHVGNESDDLPTTWNTYTVHNPAVGGEPHYLSESEPLLRGNLALSWRDVQRYLSRPSGGWTATYTAIARPLPAEILERLEGLARLSEDWDGEGGLPIAAATIEKLKELLRRAVIVGGDNLPTPFISPSHDGMLVSEWKTESGKELILDVPAGDNVPGFLLIEHEASGKELETDAELVGEWSIERVIRRFMDN